MIINNDIANKVVNEIKSIIGDMGEVECHEVEKNNGIILYGVTIRYAGENIVPTVYIENFIDIYSVREIAKEIIAAHVDARKNLPYIKPEDCTDISKVIDKLCLRLVNFESNKELLKKIPYYKFYDMAVILVIELSDTMSIKVTNEIFNDWIKRFNSDWLFDIAKTNTKKNHPENIRSLIEIMAELMGLPVDILKEVENKEMFVLTNNTKMYGATTLLYTDTLEKCAEMFNGDFAILPSSVHEVILVPIDERVTIEELNEMIIDVNENEVRDEDILSDHAYIYRKETGKLEY